jgi:hypothetical protein
LVVALFAESFDVVEGVGAAVFDVGLVVADGGGVAALLAAAVGFAECGASGFAPCACAAASCGLVGWAASAFGGWVGAAWFDAEAERGHSPRSSMVRMAMMAVRLRRQMVEIA